MRILRSIQLWLGIALAAVVAIIVFFGARIFNPPPVEVVIARQDIPPYTTITTDMFGVDAQHLHPAVAARYVTRAELPAYIQAGAVTVEPIYAGEPLTKYRLVTGEKALRLKRLSLALKDKDKVIRVIPVSPDTCPDDVYPGDVVDITLSLGSLQAREIKYEPERKIPAIMGGREKEVVLNLPVAKTVIRGALVLRVDHKKVPNPNYGLMSQGGQQPMYLEGDIERIKVLLPVKDAELLDFALHNGKITVGVRSALMREEIENGKVITPTTGFTWDDFVELFFQERFYTGTMTATLPFGE